MKRFDALAAALVPPVKAQNANRLYIKAVTDRIRREVNSRRIGDVVEAGVMISNSEVGLGSVV